MNMIGRLSDFAITQYSSETRAAIVSLRVL